MAEVITTTTAVVKGGAMLATGGVVADLVIFKDGGYFYLAIAGMVVSMLGVTHEIYGEHTKTYNKSEIFAEIIKGMALGSLAIPFWYLVFTEGLLAKVFNVNLHCVSNSIALMVSFGLSWYTIPIFNWMSNLVRKKAKNV